MKYTYPAHFISEKNGSVSVFFPDLQGCFTGGWSSLEEAFLMAKDVLEGHIESLFEEGETLPDPSKFSDVKIPDEIAGEKVDSGYTLLVTAEAENMARMKMIV
ncbi:MAG: type II toxin-antitoxin system HicB family antitoxin [Oscillospiraceae bacterium]|nr:type II toxin-antitoxin system HicB family antitoxin [Oscillospiraceae bacterium]